MDGFQELIPAVFYQTVLIGIIQLLPMKSSPIKTACKLLLGNRKFGNPVSFIYPQTGR